MEKNKELFKALAATILGILLIFLSINYFTAGGTSIATGVFALLAGIINVGGGLLSLFGLTGKIPMLPLILAIGIPASFLAFYFVMDLITIIDFNQFLRPVGWIELIISLICELGAMTFVVLALLLDNKLFVLLRNAFISVFLAFLVIRMIFTILGRTAAIGDIDILELSFAILFGIIAFEKPEMGKKGADAPKDYYGEDEAQQEHYEEPSEQVLESEPETLQDDDVREPQEPAEA